MESIKKRFKVLRIQNQETYDWLLKKHYAKRIPSISYAFGLYDNENLLQGVITFGFPPNYNFNNGKCVFGDEYSVLTLELNRLVVNDRLGKNVLSFFVSQALKQLPTPCCIVSYADPNKGHHGYIYQATNWIYTGESTPKSKYIFESGEEFDLRRGIHTKGKLVRKERLKPTHRYFYFLGSRGERNKMKKFFKYKVYSYPKGVNTKYDASYVPIVQGIFNLDMGENK